MGLSWLYFQLIQPPTPPTRTLECFFFLALANSVTIDELGTAQPQLVFIFKVDFNFDVVLLCRVIGASSACIAFIATGATSDNDNDIQAGAEL